MQFAVLAMTHMCIPKPSHPEAEGGWKKVARGEKNRRWGEKQMVRGLKPKGSRGLKRKVWGKGGKKGQGLNKRFFFRGTRQQTATSSLKAMTASDKAATQGP